MVGLRGRLFVAAFLLLLSAAVAGIPPPAAADCHPESGRCFQAAAEATFDCAAQSGTDDLQVTLGCASHAYVSGGPAAIGAAGQAYTPKATGIQVGAKASIEVRVERKGQNASLPLDFTLLVDNKTQHLTFTSPTRIQDKAGANAKGPWNFTLGIEVAPAPPVDRIALQYVFWDNKGFARGALGIKLLPAGVGDDLIPGVAALAALAAVALAAVILRRRRR